MDIDILDEILLENKNYNCSDKAFFIDQLDKAFMKFRESGDTFLIRYSGIYGGEDSAKKHKIFTFKGNHSGYYLDLEIIIKDGVVHEIIQYMCYRIHRLNPAKQIELDMEIIF